MDPTTIHLHGQRVGVVGPNGCGKSNVMESVRWVLGESSAKEMRADAMDAVIFNGSSNRKPISRASVELIFDNSLGGANGEWSQYAEIAVKRVIEREKGSTYYINNTAVRRRDVADLFLGTGLGGRAYAIIGQNTISRIVEAKPEELRIYLEEAAGISKYKERRRETELRLRDTRDNLTRVEDICRELQKQITRLESQALVAQRYHELQAQLKLAEGQLWLLRKRDASQGWEKAKAHVERLANQLEAQTAQLRKIEAEVEASRQAYYAATEAINTAQAAYYEANAEVSHLENQVKQNTEARERMTLQLQQIAHSLERNAITAQEYQRQLEKQQQDLEAAIANEAQTKAMLDACKAELPQKEAALKSAAELAQKSLSALNDAKQRIQLENNNIRFLSQSIEENTQRVQRLEAQLSQIAAPDTQQLTAAEALLKQSQQAISTMETGIAGLQKEESTLRGGINEHRDALNQAQRLVNQMEAEVHSLQKIQQSLNSEGKLNEWLTAKGLKQQTRLWQKVNIDPTWSVAFESVLGQRLNALIAESLELSQRPPGALVMAFAGKVKPSNQQSKLVPLMHVVKECAPEIQMILQDWLEGTYLLEDEQAPEGVIDALRLGERVVNRQGDIFSSHSVIYHGENSSLHGVIERQQRLESLLRDLPSKQTMLEGLHQQLTEAEKRLQQTQQRITLDNQQLKSTTQRLHQQQLELSRLQQAKQAALDREKSIKTDIEIAKTRLAELQANVAEKRSVVETLNGQLMQLEASKEAAVSQYQQVEQTYRLARNAVNQAEKAHQEAGFNIRLINNNINELNNKVNVNIEEKNAFVMRQSEAEQMLELTPMETLKANLTQAIDAKQHKEAALAAARNQAAIQESQLQAQEKARLQTEQQLHPMRDDLEKSRLQEQEARLYFEQCQAGLQTVGIDETELSKDLPENTKTSVLLAKTNELKQTIEALGPVNLAAIQELATERERKVYLDSQMQDLLQASETLDEAIRKIDRETRDKLMHTFNTANGHFSELFKTLFGGGQAKLELLGEEILDTGLQVFAQPPGKKNTTIQLLSGGEKALTALALVFALFRLNPAPFCLMDEVDAPLDDSNTERFCAMVRKMSERTQFLFVSHNKITMEMAQQLIGVTMQESGVSRVVDVDMDAAMKMHSESMA